MKRMLQQARYWHVVRRSGQALVAGAVCCAVGALWALADSQVAGPLLTLGLVLVLFGLALETLGRAGEER